MIDIENVSFRYTTLGKQVFNNLNISISDGKIYGLLAKNGTGKTTLLYLISGLLRPTSGKVTFDGTGTALRQPEVLREMFIVPESYSLPGIRLSDYVRRNSVFYPRFSEETLRKCLDEFHIDKDVNLRNLSMGEKKKVYMSMALASGTRLLLLDEPTNGLDIPSKSAFRKVIADDMRDDRTIIISTHQVHDIEQLVNHVIILEGSKVALDASVADIADRYVFTHRDSGEDAERTVYSERSTMGDIIMARRGMSERTPVNLEILFNAVTGGYLKQDD